MIKPKKFKFTKAKVNNQNTRHGKMDMPFTALNEFSSNKMLKKPKKPAKLKI